MKNRNFIDYIASNEADSDLTSRIDGKVKEAIEKRLWRKEYMTYKEQMDQEFKKGLEQGREEGVRALVNSLKEYIKDFDSLYNAVIRNEEYKNVTRDEVMKYYDNIS